MQKKMTRAKKIEISLEKALFASRWLIAPFYVGLVGSLLILLYSFCLELFETIVHFKQITPTTAVLSVLSLIDLSLAGNLLLIVIFSGYENFVSKMDIDDHEDEPEWMGTVDFATLKLKLVASIVAISGIHLLKAFMDVDEYSSSDITYMIVIHIVFVFSGVLLAIMDYIATKTKLLKQ
jgi:uncharacterized protein (TIGR00645 family)